jgi:hypothetical protein
MLQIDNQTPLASAISLFTDNRGATLAAVAVKGTFDIRAMGALNVAEVQKPVFLSDVHYGDPAESGVKYPCELVMGKRATDVGLVGQVHSPTGDPVRQLDASLRVGPLRKSIRVFGDRVWEGLGGITLTPSTPEPFVSMPIVYERCFGGPAGVTGDRAVDFNDSNPIGVGFATRQSSARGLKLPNIEDPGHLMKGPTDKPPVAGLGFVAPSWQPRRQYAGTYDDAWREHVFPVLPSDFDDRFFNCAPPGLTSNGFLEGGEAVELINLCSRGPLRFNLPAIALWLEFTWCGALVRRKANMWTVTLEPDAGSYSVVWGGAIDVVAQPSRLLHVRAFSRWLSA